jgi:opacity protein-like surface antigen
MSRSTTFHSVVTLVCAFLASVFFLAPSASAQSALSRIEIYGGYSFLHPDLPGKLDPTDPSTARTLQSILGNLSGWDAGATIRVTNYFGVTSDVSGYYKSFNTSVDGIPFVAKLRAHTFVFGPQFTKRGEQLRPFARALFGALHASGQATAYADTNEVSRTVFAASVGGGLDVKVHDNIAIRAGQLDYYPFHTSEGGGFTFNNFRFGGGVVFYLR